VIWDNFRIALAAILANKMRSLLTTLGIIIGVAAVIAVVAIVQGLNQVISDQFEGVGATFIMVVPRVGLIDPEMAGREVTLTYDDGLAIMERVSGIEYFTPVFFRTERVRSGSWRHITILLGVGLNYQEVDDHWVGRGRFFSELDMARGGRVCVIGADIIDELELAEPVLGTDIILGDSTFTVVGVMEQQGEVLGEDRDDLVLIPITTARAIYGNEALKQIRLQFQAANADTVDLVRDQIEEVLRQRHNLGENMPDDFQIVLQEELLEATSTVLGTVTSVVAGVVGISLLVGGIGIMNIMLVSVTERTREIGIRKAVGARSSDLLVQFLIEAVTLSLLGGVLGILAGWGLGVLGASAIPGFPPAHVPWWAIAIGVGFAALVGIFFGTYPAAKAAALDPIDALRYE
jgi:putative ABC transport system permease protein